MTDDLTYTSPPPNNSLPARTAACPPGKSTQGELARLAGGQGG